MRKQFIGTTRTWSAKVDAKERAMQLETYQREHADNSLNGNSAGNSHDAYMAYRKELMESDYNSFLESMPDTYIETGRIIEHVQKKELDLSGSVLDIIANNKIHVAITASIVSRLASSPRRESPACAQIIKSHFKDTIFADLCMAVYEKMIKLVNDNELTFDLDEKRLIFAEREAENGTTSAYIDLYRAVTDELTLYKSAGYSDEKTILDDMTSYKGIVDFTQSADLEKKLSSEEFKEFMTYIQVHDSKNFDNYLSILSGLFAGVTYKTISEKIGLSERQIKYLKSKLERFYNNFYHGTDKYHVVKYFKYDKNGQKKTDKNGNIKVYSYKYYMF